MAKGAYFGALSFEPRELPEGYTQLEYIENEAGAYFDTGFIPNQNTRVVMEVSTSYDSTAAFFGCRVANGQSSFIFWKMAENEYRVDFGDNQQTVNVSAPERFTIDMDKNVCKFAGRTVSLDTSIFSAGCPLLLLTANTNGEVDNRKLPAKIHYVQIYDNGVLAHDYVPCTNPSGTSGLYDFTNSSFQSSASSEAFTAGSSENKELAHKIAKGYFGVSNLAREIKKAYIGIGGVARPCWAGGTLVRYGLITPLSVARGYFAAANVAQKYALFGGGEASDSDGTTYYNTADVYDKSLTHTTATALSSRRSNLAAASVGNYALFGGGYSSGCVDTVDAYNSSLTRTTPTVLSYERQELAAASIGNYALFGGGRDYRYKRATIDAYNSSLTRTLPSGLYTGVYDLAAASSKFYAMFGGGNSEDSSGGISSKVNAYNASLTRTWPSDLSLARDRLSAASVGNYVLFAGGRGRVGSLLGAQTTVDAYDESLTRTLPTALSSKAYFISATQIGDYAIIGVPSLANIYDKSLTRTTIASQARRYGAATTIGDYALFGNNDSSVDAFMLT